MSDIAKELAERLTNRVNRTLTKLAPHLHFGPNAQDDLESEIRETLDPVLQALIWYGEIAESAAKQTNANYKLALLTELALDNGRRAKKVRGL